MNKHLEQLVKLSSFDKDIVGFEPQIKNEEEKLKVYTEVIDRLNDEIEKTYQIIDETKNKRIKNDIHLKELADKLAEIEGKHKIAKTEKEVKALQLEEEIAKEQVSFANEEIVRLDALIETKNAELEEFKAKLVEEEETVKSLREVIDTNISELNNKRGSLYEEKSVLVAEVDPKILAFYEKIKRWAAESAVVPVKKQACYGCHMKLSDRFYSEFTVSDEIMTCPHCGRIIFKDSIES